MENTQKRRTREMENTGNGEHPETENAGEFSAARKQLGMTQQQLADALGFRRGFRTVSDIECGRQNPSSLAVKFLRALVDAKVP